MAEPVPPAAAANTRERVLAVASGLFLERGYDRTTVSAIAGEVGIKAPALYWHFTSKEDILYAIIEDFLKRFLNALAVPETLDPPGRLRAVVRRYVQFQLGLRADVMTYSSIVQVAQLDHVLSPEHQRELTRLQREVMEIFRGILRAGVAAGQFRLSDVTVTAFALVSLCEHVVSWARPDGRLSIEDIAGQYADLADRIVGNG
ncbi:TetR/AcrR family transcriptional regulator [Amycolatopsis jejuensis]|uniref:TetR/AcrR family transcriptional regulator n=1 Tax=Amycolatopsis jejuensis TaxID=330084 RepID=UPI00052726C3|nr:TetR/AcrR family transcriptional regulator [Amycolatopsis jejuensis]